MNEKINYEIEGILVSLKDIDNIKIKNKKDFLENKTKNLAASMCIFNILNSCIELGEEIISDEGLETPFKYKEIYLILEKNNILSKKISIKLSKYMYDRNMLAHQYGKIDLEKIYKIIEDKQIILDFIDEIKNFVKH